jgi:hypothetical protein
MKQKNKSGFAPIIVVILLAVALVAALGFIFYQNMNKKDDKVANTTSTTSTQSSITSTTKADFTGYLVLDDWGVKFKIPIELQSTTINKYKLDGHYYFTTSRSETVEGCKNDGTVNPMLRSLSRYENEQKTDGESNGGLISKLGSYYYYSTPPQAPCWDVNVTVKDEDSISQDISNLYLLLKNIESL